MAEQQPRPIYGLTGGMGSGKSTVARRFEENGAYVVDADQVVCDLQLPGSPMLDIMVAVLGEDIIVGGELDRKKVATRIFGDKELNSRLRVAMNPGIYAEVEKRVSQASEGDTVIYDVPLLDKTRKVGGQALTGIIVVDTPVELAVERLRDGRGINQQEALRRLSHQISREERGSYLPIT